MRGSVSILGHAGTPDRRPRPAGDHSASGWRRSTQRNGPGCRIFSAPCTTAQGDFPAAEHFLQQSLSLYEELGDESGIAASLNALAVSARDRGDYASAQSNFERSLACWRMLPDRLAIARCLHNLANVVKVRGDYPRARWALREATDIFEELGDRSGAAWSINQQGDIAREQGDLAAARELYQRALSAFREAGRPVGFRAVPDRLGLYRLRARRLIWLRTRHTAKLWKSSRGLGHRRGMARALEGSACLALAQGQRRSRAETGCRRSASAPA